MKNKHKHYYSPAKRTFFRAMILTAAVVSLVLIGYFTVGYFSGKL